jgi:hypothetical protein
MTAIPGKVPFPGASSDVREASAMAGVQLGKPDLCNVDAVSMSSVCVPKARNRLLERSFRNSSSLLGVGLGGILLFGAIGVKTKSGPSLPG